MNITPKNNHLGQYKTLAIILGLTFFCFSTAAAILFQKLILPNMTSMLVSGTNLTTDSALYDSIAMEMANEVKLHGWSSLTLFPDYNVSGHVSINVSGHVSILAALYVLFGHDPALAIPINSLFHALGGIMIFMIALELSSDYLIGIRAGIIASCLFILFPSALNWYGQLLKDGYSIAAILAILLVWLKGMTITPNTSKFFYLILLSTLALVFLFVIRPYFFKLTLLFAFITFFVSVIWRVISKKKNCWVFFLYVILTFVPIHVFLSGAGSFSVAKAGGVYSEWSVSDIQSKYETLSIEKQQLLEGILDWEWRHNDSIPNVLDKQMETVAKTRVGLIAFGVMNNAGSLVDIEESPSSFIEVIGYIPRALQVSLLAPFPNRWLDKLSAIRILSVVEMIVIYACLLGLIPLVRFNRNLKVVFTFCFSVFFLIVYGFISANVGTLYRVRYAFELLMVLLGVIGWVSYFNKPMFHRLIAANKGADRACSISASSSIEKNNLGHRKSAIGAAVSVSMLTLVGFLGFFLRDVLMAQQFGFGKDVDEFFLALVTPMFVVNVFCTPLGTALVPFLKRVIAQRPSINISALISNLIVTVLFVILFLSIAIYIATPAILKSMGTALQGVVVTQNLSVLIVLALIILILSGVVILGNSALITYGRLVIPSAVQIVVPVISIMALLLFGSSYGVISVMAGMVIGQIVNLIVIHFFLKKYGVSVMPRYKPEISHELLEFWELFFPLLGAAFFAGIMQPVDMLLASKLTDGSVAIFNLGAKIVLFVSGILGAVISNVMLPYFSTMIEKKDKHLVKKELSFFMMASTFISIPTCVLLYVFSESILRVIFFNNAFHVSDLRVIHSVMQYSLVQIPFLICNILLLKYATATRHTVAIVFSAFVGLIVNIGLSLTFMPTMGVSGIALATSLAMIASSALLLAMLVFYGHVSLVDLVVVILNWMLFLTLIIGLHFQSAPSVLMTIFSYAILLFVFSRPQKFGGENFAT